MSKLNVGRARARKNRRNCTIVHCPLQTDSREAQTVNVLYNTNVLTAPLFRSCSIQIFSAPASRCDHVLHVYRVARNLHICTVLQGVAVTVSTSMSVTADRSPRLILKNANTYECIHVDRHVSVVHPVRIPTYRSRLCITVYVENLM